MGRKRMEAREVICADCGKPFMMAYSTWNRLSRDGKPLRCKECLSKWRSNENVKRALTRTDEEKAVTLDRFRNTMANKTDEEKAMTHQRRSEAAKRREREHRVEHPTEVEVRCVDCGKAFMVKYNTWRKNTKHDRPFRCYDCYKQWQSIRVRNTNIGVPDSMIADTTNDNNTPRVVNKKHVQVKCCDCGKEFEITYGSYTRNIHLHKPFRCKECHRKWISEYNSRRFANMSNEEKSAYSASRREIWAKRTDDEKAAIIHKRKATNAAKSEEEKRASCELMSRRWAEKSDVEKMEINHKRSESRKRLLSNMPEEEKRRQHAKASETNKRIWAEKSEDERAAHGQKISEAWQTKSTDEIEQFRHSTSEGHKRLWANKSVEEHKAHGRKVSGSWAKKSDDEKKQRNEKISSSWLNRSDEEKLATHELRQQQWMDKSDAEKEAHGQKISLSLMNRPLRAKIMTNQKRSQSLQNKKHGSLPLWFEHEFDKMESNGYVSAREKENHSDIDSMNQDYTIRDLNRNLVALVEIDDSGSHGDGSSEYNRSSRHGNAFGHEQRDAERGLTIPDGIPFIIISEECKEDSFRDLVSMLGKPYEEYTQWMYQHLRYQPFPYPSYSPKQIMTSYNRLRNRLKVNEKKHKMRLAMDHWDCLYGQHIMYHFYHSIWHDSMPGKMCPHDAYMDNDILMDMIRKRYILHVRNRNKITQCFLLSEEAPRVPIFTPIMGMKVLHKYCNDYNIIVDCNTQYGGVLLASLAMNKKYIGYDSDLAHYNESNQLINWLTDMGMPIDAKMIDHVPSGDCMCSYVPFGDEWISGLLDRFVCSRYVFIVPETEKYKSNIAETYTTDDHWGEHQWHIIVINREDLNARHTDD